jgi:predicted AAA+ superfamily ATPase
VRALLTEVAEELARVPVVGLLGPRQCGKTTLACELAALRAPAERVTYLDLERPSDRRKLSDPELFLADKSEELVILDEIQLAPDLFPVLRSLVDQHRHPGRFLVLGSASPDLLRQSAESLAGRIAYRELTPLHWRELLHSHGASPRLVDQRRHWLRGGFPESLLHTTDAASLRWREDFVRTFVERDLVQFGISADPGLFRKFVRMLSHYHGELVNYSKLAESVGISIPTAKHYLRLLESAFLVRILEPLELNLKKRLVKSPKIYWRDSGLLHALLEIETADQLAGHVASGPSWEGYVLENLLAALPRWRPSFYRTQTGVELDLVLERGDRRIGVECKLSLAPKTTRGFHQALTDLELTEAWLLAPVEESYPIDRGPRVGNIQHLVDELC